MVCLGRIAVLESHSSSLGHSVLDLFSNVANLFPDQLLVLLDQEFDEKLTLLQASLERGPEQYSKVVQELIVPILVLGRISYIFTDNLEVHAGRGLSIIKRMLSILFLISPESPIPLNSHLINLLINR